MREDGANATYPIPYLTWLGKIAFAHGLETSIIHHTRIRRRSARKDMVPVGDRRLPAK
jgi:hypothetical protein